MKLPIVKNHRLDVANLMGHMDDEGVVTFAHESAVTMDELFQIFGNIEFSILETIHEPGELPRYMKLKVHGWSLGDM